MRPTALIALILFPSLASCDSALGAVGETTNPSPWIATATGRIDSIDEARQLVASIDGVISHVLVRRGDRIAQGQILMRIDCAAREAAARAGAAEAASALLAARSVSSGTSADRAALIAEIDAATARLANEEAQLRRAEEILDRGFIARSVYDERVQTRAAAEAALRSSRARLADLEGGRRPAETATALSVAEAARRDAETARTMAEQCAVRSPIDGTVLQILRREGEHSGAAQGAPLLIVGDLSQLLVRAEVMEQDAASVRVGQRAEIWVDGAPDRWSGRVAHAAAVMGRRSARSLDPTDRFDRDVREVLITLEDRDGRLPALVGLRVTVGILP